MRECFKAYKLYIPLIKAALCKEEYLNILKVGDGDIIRWSAAPELPGAEEFAVNLNKQGVLPSIGHSDADHDAVESAYNAGFTHVTHLYSCTSGVHRKGCYRYAGIIEMAYLLDGMTVEIIADGIHLPAQLLKLCFFCFFKEKRGK